MIEQNETLEQRVARLERQVAELGAALAALRAGPAPARDEACPPRPLVSGPAGTSEELLSWVDRAYLLPRLATTSFILVVALALRTLADSGTVDLQFGTLLGMAYAFALIAYAWLAYGRNSPQAPVFTLWGTVVMCAVVVETHRVFQALPTVIAYLLLATTGWASVLMSRRFRVALPVFAGTIGMSFGAFAINYPSPVFPLLTVIMILANAFAAYASGLLRASWLRWLLFALTLFMVQIWVLKLGIYLARISAEALDFSMQGFLPALWGLALAFAAIALAGVLGRIQEKVSKFDILLPVLNVLWVVAAASHVLGHNLVEPWVFGLPAVLLGGGHLGVAWWLTRRGGAAAHGTTSFALAGGLLIALALPYAVGHALPASTATAALAVGLALAAHRTGAGGVRVVSYLLQFYASCALVVLLRTTETTAPSLGGALASGLLAVIGAYHYAWARNHPPAPGGPLTDRFNRGDRWAALLLIAALLSGFFTLRMGLYQGLHELQMATPRAFAAGQSLLINLAAAVLLVVGLRQRSKELRNVGVLITLVAAGKVLVDVFSFKGVPLLVSIFSFGVVAAIASYVLGRWGRVAEIRPELHGGGDGAG
ncbi:MAG: hypothetical protein FDZ69_03975 [Deltaproteobacteria bacterium]|nr:MAG: hypothetical protein FDZ69_03975 [Deltaproteobacteria bacterium]